MTQIQEIQTLELPELAPYRTMRRQSEHREQGFFIAEGEKVVRRLLESDFAVVSLLLPARWLREYEPLLRSRQEPIRAYVAEKEILERLTGFSMYQGVLAIGKIPPAPNLDAILEKSGRPCLFAAIEDLSNAENVGVMARNCVAFGVQALLVGRSCGSPFLRRAVRSSMGAVFRLPVIEGIDLPQTLRDLRARGLRCVAAHPRSERRTLAGCNFTADCCLVFGGEGYGIPAETVAACDESVAIPMAGGVDSLNVANAAAVFFYEAGRQRAETEKTKSVSSRSEAD